MNLVSILEEHENFKAKLKQLFQTRGDLQAFMDFDDMEILFLIKPPNKKEIIDIAKNIAEVGDDDSIIFRAKGIFATNQIKKKINDFVKELEKVSKEE